MCNLPLWTSHPFHLLGFVTVQPAGDLAEALRGGPKRQEEMDRWNGGGQRVDL